MVRNKQKRTTPRITHRQNQVLHALAEGQTASEICRKMGVKPGNLKRWMKTDIFRAELAGRIEASRQMGNVLLTRCMPEAAVKLAGLMEAENPETARKACVDVLKLQTLLTHRQMRHREKKPSEIDSKLAERLLKILTADPVDESGGVDSEKINNVHPSNNNVLS